MFMKSVLENKFGFFILLALLLIIPSASFTQTSNKINWTRMQRDLDIMEGVLTKLLKPAPFELGFGSSKTLGIYFEGYGAVFQVNANGNMAYVVAGELYKSAKARLKAEKEIIELKSQNIKDEPEIASVVNISESKVGSNMAERIQNTKNQLTEFLGDYADAIGQLRNTDRVTVLVNFGRNNVFTISTGYIEKDKEKAIDILEATAKKNDIIEFRRGNINQPTFKKRIVFRERTQDDKMRKNIDIMANIMNTALNKKYHKNFSSEGKTHGIYLDGLGALFFMKGNLDWNGFRTPVHLYVEELAKGQEEYVVRKKQEQKSRKKFRESIDEYKKALIEVVGDYGHTLRTLKATEHVVVAVNFSNVWGYSNNLPNRIIMKVPKKELDRYSRGDFKLAAFQKKVEFIEY